MSETPSDKDAVPEPPPPDSSAATNNVFFLIDSSGALIPETTQAPNGLPSTHSEVEEPMSEPDNLSADPDFLRLSDDENDSEDNVSATSPAQSDSETSAPSSPLRAPEDRVSDSSPAQSDSETSTPSSPLPDRDEGAPPGEKPAVAVENSDWEPENVEFVSRNGQINWHSHPVQPALGRRTKPFIMRVTPGPTKVAMQCAKDKTSVFKLFLTSNITKNILATTNLEGKRVFQDEWKDMDGATLDAYIGLLLLAGVYRSRGEATLSLWSPDTGRSIFPATMSLQQFRTISRTLRFSKHDKSPKTQEENGGERKSRQRDKLAPIRDVWDMWVKRLPLMYNPGVNVTVDERLIPYRGRCPFRQYMPSKPAKYGIKIWAACDAKTSYAYNMQVYTGKIGGALEKGEGKRVVLDMVEGLEGRTVTVDNFFTSYGLAEELLDRNLTMLGTVRRNRPELPRRLLRTDKRKTHSSLFLFNEKATLVSYCPKRNKNVLLMSTAHDVGKLSARDDRKPLMIMDYNATKGGVDVLDQCTGYYSCQRVTRRWPVVLFSNILDVSAFNAYVIWSERTDGKGKLPRRVFLEELGKELLRPFVQRREACPRSPAAKALCDRIKGAVSPKKSSPKKRSGTNLESAAAHRPAKRARCSLCPSARDRKTGVTCAVCSKYICKEHAYVFCESCTRS